MSLAEFIPARRDLWTLRYYYFIYAGGTGLVGPFMNLFLVSQHMDGVQIGWIVAFGSAVALIAAPLWTRLSAASGKPLHFLQVSILLLGLAGVLLSQQQVFLWLALVYGLRVLVGAGIGPLSDAIAVRAAEGLQTGYGSIRVWASFGWAVLVLSGGWLVQSTGLPSAFFAFAIACLVAAGLLLCLDPRLLPAQSGPAKAAAGFGVVAGNILHTPALLGLGLALVLVGFGNLGVNQFENVYLSQLGAKEGLIGIASMVSSVVELPGMFLADRLTRRFSTASLLILALGMTAFWRALVFIFPGVATIIAVRAVGGISFSIYTVAMIKYISGQTAPAETATALAIFTVTLPSLINITGTPLAGLFFDHLGAHWLYAVACAGYVLAAAALWFAQQSRREDFTTEAWSTQRKPKI
jgi:MFS transporter, PPP family, 3-phenylpropionic acid transporter